MKIADKITDKADYQFLILETTEDVDAYTQIDVQIKSKQAIGFWFGFKSQSFRATPLDYLAHEVENNAIASPLALKMSLKTEPTSLVEYCSHADSLIIGLHSSFYKFVSRGEIVRINSVGGCCPIDDLSEFSKVGDISNQQMINWLLHKNIDEIFEVNKPCVIIENSNKPPKELFNYCIAEFEQHNVQILNNFKTRTILFSEQDFLKLLFNGLENNVSCISFATTTQDIRQVDSMKKALEYVMSKYPLRNMDVIIKTDHKDIFKTSSKNINVRFL